MADEVTTTAAGALLGLRHPDPAVLRASARRALSRLGIRPLYRQPGKAGESMWDADQIRAAINDKTRRPGQGHRTDLRRHPMRHTSRQDVIEQAILPALGNHADDYDVDAICQETFEYRVDTDAHGNELLNTAGFEQTVTDDEFWQIAARHDRSQ